MDFEAFLADLPLLHSWDGGETWDTGGFQPRHLRTIHDTVASHVGDDARILETGAGNSTLTFLHLNPSRLVSIAPDEDLRDRILGYCEAHGLPVDAYSHVLDRSERALPPMALEEQRFDVALLDGGHGWPTVFVDFCYANMMLRKGGLLLVDDLQLHSVAELGRLLEQQSDFETVEDMGKIQVLKKTTNRRFLPGHSHEPYITQRSKRRRAPNLRRRMSRQG